MLGMRGAQQGISEERPLDGQWGKKEKECAERSECDERDPVRG